MHVVRGYRAALENGEGMNHQAGPESGDANSTAPAGADTEDALAEATRAEHTAGEPSAGSAGVGAIGAEAIGAEAAGPDAAGDEAAGDEAVSDDQTGAAAEEFEPARPATGEPRVDAALTLLDRLGELPVTEHVSVFEQVHAELTAVLGQLDPDSADTDG
jgi:hypothetical protein